MYDLACPIIDHLDGVTHALRANEYWARHEQYQWFLKTLGFANIEIFDFSRVDFVYTVLSKRKLKYLVEKNVVKGWDDPRFPTVRGGPFFLSYVLSFISGSELMHPLLSSLRYTIPRYDGSGS